jgi:glycerol-3-phosphate dehydrogenase
MIIGAGFTGCATAHDLALRGFAVTVVERGEIASGTSGRTHGLLHSGGRYCVTDQEAAIECVKENITLRNIARQCIEYNGGIFIALDESDLAYAKSFAEGAQACHIPIEEISPKVALELEPNLNPQLLAAFLVPDGAFDPLRLALAFAATAKQNGAIFLTFNEVTNLAMDGKGKVSGVKVWDRAEDKKRTLDADIIVNATGAWAGLITAMAHVNVAVTPTPGVMVAYNKRLVQRVVNRLCEPADGDILLPQRRMVVVGTTSFEVKDIDYIPVVADQIKMMYTRALQLVPAVAQTKMRGAYMSARPLIGTSVEGRSLSRTFRCYDHKEEGIDGLVTITGGKATTCRAMAEKTADLVCEKLGIHTPCVTNQVILTSYRNFYLP